jgi:CDP-glycerol glycerophosphotransferase (TagB/SpsB family)
MGASVPTVELGLNRPFTRFAARYLEALLPATKLGIYRDNLDFFRSLDALVVAEKTSLLLKTRYGLGGLRVIHTRHGAGDRAIGFDKASAQFDHVLVSGPKIRERLIAEAGVSPDRLSMVGYPKFDLWPAEPRRLPFQANGKPTVLYNPHPSPHLSSWFQHGQAVLEHFLRDDRYNLIFAPHVMLFHRRFVLTIDKLRIDRPGTIDRRFLEAPNIHIDLGSQASTDMTYTSAADIYLGDVSSQIYEFLHTPRPCLFLDAHGTDWRGDANYAHWQTGEVIGDPAHLGAALDRAVREHDRHLPIQKALFARSFDLTAEPSADRAARAVLAAVEKPALRLVA